MHSISIGFVSAWSVQFLVALLCLDMQASSPFACCRFQLDELREIIVQLELEQEGLTRRLLQKDRQMESLQKALTTAQQQLASKQLKLDKVSWGFLTWLNRQESGYQSVLNQLAGWVFECQWMVGW